MATRYKITVNDNYPEAGDLIEAITVNGQPGDAPLVYIGRRNTLFYLPSGEETDGKIINPLPFPVNVKAFRIPPFPNGYVYRFFRPGKAKRSYLNGQRLLAMGFLNPQPIGFSELQTGLRLKGDAGLWLKMTRSYYFCKQLPYPNMRGWEERSDAEELVKAFGAEIARIHKAGVWFHDFSPGNVLVETTNDGKYNFYYVDLNRMDFDIHDKERLMQMFKTISWHDSWTARVAEAYAEATGKDRDTTVAEALGAAHKWRDRHAKKEKLKGWIKKLRAGE